MNSWLFITNSCLQVLNNKMNLSIECPKLAGRAAHFLPNWEVLIQDQRALQNVDGCQLELTSTPYQTRVPQQVHCSPESKLQITTEVLELLTKGAIVETQQTPHNFVSQLFLVEKKDGGQRPVISLKCLNQFVKTEHFKMEGLHLHVLPDLLQTQGWMVKMGLPPCRFLSTQTINPSSPPIRKKNFKNSNTCPLVSQQYPECSPSCWSQDFLRQIGCRLIILILFLLFIYLLFNAAYTALMVCG